MHWLSRSLPWVGLLAVYACGDDASPRSESADAGPDAGAQSETSTGDTGAEAGTCPQGWVCPAVPVYTSVVGSWYTNIYRITTDTKAPGYAEAFHWSDCRYRPSLGTYDSDNVGVLSTHLDQMKAARIDFLMLDGTNGYSTTLAYDTDVLIHTQLKRDPSMRIPIALTLGAQLWANPPGTASAVPNHQAEVDKGFVDFANNATQNFTYAKALSNTAGAEPINSVYFKWDSKPLMVVYNPPSPGGNNGIDWMDPRFTVRRAGSIVNPNAQSTKDYGALGWWGWVTEYPQYISKEAIAVSPGADNKHRGCAGCDYALDRENGQLFIREWLRAIENNPRVIVIAAWNDNIDETAIEPASPIAGKGGPAYVDSYGVETPDWYLQIASAYSNLRTGLMPDNVYRDDDSTTMFRVTAGKLVAESSFPHNRPVIVLPKGTLANLLR